MQITGTFWTPGPNLNRAHYAVATPGTLRNIPKTGHVYFLGFPRSIPTTRPSLSLVVGLTRSVVTNLVRRFVLIPALAIFLGHADVDC